MESPNLQYPPGQQSGSGGVNKVLITSIAIVVFIAGYATYAKFGDLWPFKESQSVVCTLDAKLCPDGSYVGRTGPNCEFTACPGATPDVTEGWKTYTSSAFSISLSTPSDWSIQEPSATSTGLTVSNNAVTYTSEVTGTYHPTISIYRQADTFGGSITAFEKTLHPSLPPLRAKQTILIGGKTAYVYQGETSASAQDFRVVFANNYVYTIGSNNLMIQAYQGNTQGASAKSDFDQILSTFKFTTTAATTNAQLFTAIRGITSWEERSVNNKDLGWYLAPGSACNVGRQSTEPVTTFTYRGDQGAANCTTARDDVSTRVIAALSDNGWQEVSCGVQPPPVIRIFKKGQLFTYLNLNKGCAGGAIGNADISLSVQGR